jgi:hypothetical protein
MVFKDNYPNSSFIKQASRIEQETKQTLNKLNN